MKKKLFYAKLVLQGRIADSPARMPWFARRTESLLQDLVEALEFAARHPRVRKLLIVSTGSLSGSRPAASRKGFSFSGWTAFRFTEFN